MPTRSIGIYRLSPAKRLNPKIMESTHLTSLSRGFPYGVKLGLGGEVDRSLQRMCRRISLATYLVFAGWFSVSMATGNPLEISVQVQEQVLADETFPVFVTANALVSVELEYGDDIKKVTAHDSRTLFSGQLGLQNLTVTARDNAGNTVIEIREINAIRAQKVEIHVADSIYRGDPYVIRLSWEGLGDQDAWVEAVQILAGDQELPVFVSGTSGYAFGSIDLVSDNRVISFTGRIVDEFREERTVEKTVRILEYAHPVLNLEFGSGNLNSLDLKERVIEESRLRKDYGDGRIDRLWQSSFRVPVIGPITGAFGQGRRYPGLPEIYPHSGVDIAAKTGTEILATNSGVVVETGFFSIRGGVVVIDHGAGLSSIYCHQSRMLVETGDWVNRGQVIGYVGSTGLSTGPHLHWEVRLRGVPMNPFRWLELDVEH